MTTTLSKCFFGDFFFFSRQAIIAKKGSKTFLIMTHII